MPVVIGHSFTRPDYLTIPGVPTFNPMMLLHGDEKVEVIKKMEPGMILIVEETLIDL